MRIFPSFRFFVFIVIFGSWISIHSHGQPIQGCYIGAYLGCGQQDSSCIKPADFNLIACKNHYCFSRYINADDNGDLLNTAHWHWADTLKTMGAKPVFFLMPFGNLQNYHNGAKDSALSVFAQSIASFQDTVYIIFGHEMNGNWYDWGQDSINYKLAFRHVYTLMHNLTTYVRLCWVAIQAWGQDAYSPYYPGDTYTDWVGMNLYERDYDENNLIGPDHIYAGISYLDFYEQFSKNPGKPMLIAETGYFDANTDPTLPGIRVPLTDSLQCVKKNAWISQLYDVTQLSDSFPNLNMIIYFHVLKDEPFSTSSHNFGTIPVDWRICIDTSCNTGYTSLILNPYFIGAPDVIPGMQNNTQLNSTEPTLKVYPNPVRDCMIIEYYLPERSRYKIYLINAIGQRVEMIKDGYEEGMVKINYHASSIYEGVFFIVLKTNKSTIKYKIIV